MTARHASELEILDPTAELEQLPDICELADTIVMPLSSDEPDPEAD